MASEPREPENPIPDIERRISPDDRARQFMPFAALRGLDELFRERERQAADRADRAFPRT